LAKIAVDLVEPPAAAVSPSGTLARSLDRGDAWWVEEVVCVRGPHDRPFEEQHEQVTIAIVTAGTFQYRGSGPASGRELMTPGSVLLGNPGQSYECGHEHATGDRCVAFHYTPAYMESVATGPSRRRSDSTFRLLRLPPVRQLSPVIAQAQAAAAGVPGASWEELAARLAAQAMQVDEGIAPPRPPVSAAAIARVTETVRLIDQCSERELTLADLAHAANLSPFYFLRTFEELTGVTPHQYLARMRLQKVAKRLLLEPTKILDVALDSGFGDVSNFNRAFRAEFGMTPRDYRRLARR
jgi:AraC family transcriptional regulator